MKRIEVLKKIILSNSSNWLAYSFGIILALILSSYLFTWTFLQGYGAFFETKDPAQHVSGVIFYLNDEWHFPLSYTKTLNYPEGANITLTDSIPLAALVAKLFHRWLPAQFHYIGWWHLLAYILQSIAAVFLIRALGLRSLFAAFIAAAFCLLMPEFTFRYSHTSLLTQALLLFAMGAYVLGITKQNSLMQCSVFFNLINIFAFLIHPYLFGMTFLIFVAFLMDFSLKNKIFKSTLESFVIAILIILFVFFLFGDFAMKGDEGFGFYSMNLLSPFCKFKYSFCYPRGQYEGFNYLGIGLIALLALVFIINRNGLFHLPRRYPAAATICILFSLFAVSNQIYLGKYNLITIPLPNFLLHLASIYRSSGRFFWPVGYTLLFWGLAGLLHHPRKVLMVFILLIALTLQWFDTKDLLEGQKSDINRIANFNYSRWADLAESIKAIDIFPLFSQSSGNDNFRKFFLRLAANNNLLLNTAILAHYKDTSEKINFFDKPLVKDHLYIIMPNTDLKLFSQFQKLIENKKCRSFEEQGSLAVACVLNSDNLWWREKAPWMKDIR